MLIVALSGLFVFDIVLVLAVLMLFKSRQEPTHILREINEERSLFNEQKSQIQEEMEQMLAQSRHYFEQVSKMATEAEQELKQGIESLRSEVDLVVRESSSKFEGPLSELAKRSQSIQLQAQKIEKEKKSLQATLIRAERLTNFFDSRASYQDVLSELEDKKYLDARQLLTQGQTPDEVANQLGMSPAEVRMLIGFSGV